MAKISIILCAVLLFILLRIERKFAHDVSVAIWIPTIWMLYINSKPLAAWFPNSGATPESSPIDRIFLAILFLIALVIIKKRNLNLERTAKENSWLIIVIIYMLVSVLWSSIPVTSIVRWIREVQVIVMGLIVLSERSPRQAMESILRRTIYVLIPISLLLIQYFPRYGRMYHPRTGSQSWIGVALQKNGLGLLCLISIGFVIWSYFSRRFESKNRKWQLQDYIEIGILIIAIWLLRGAEGEQYSAASIGALVIGEIVFWIAILYKKRGKRINLKALISFNMIIIVVGTISLFTGGSLLGSFASNAGRDKTLTGRTEIWASLLPNVIEKPLFGSGFGGFFTPQTRTIYEVSEARNGYLELLLELGFVGLVLVSMFFIASCKKAHRIMMSKFNFGILWIFFIIITIVHNLAESSINSFANPLMAILLFLSLIASKVEEISMKTST